MSVTITRKIEFDMGHRIPDHGSKCRNAHGHRYVLLIEAAGPVVEEAGRADTGMVVDFGDLKALAMSAVGEPWDHAFMVYAQDDDMMAALDCLPPDHKTIVVPFVPTVENMAAHALQLMRLAVEALDNGLTITSVTLYETPNCWAVAK